MRRDNAYILKLVFCFSVGAALFLPGLSFAAKLPMPDLKGQFGKKSSSASMGSQVTIQADQVSFSNANNEAHAKGNVVISTNKHEQLFCDQLDMDRTIQQVVANGNVYLDTDQEQVIAQGLTYNFNTGTGEFRDAKVYLTPYQIEGAKLNKVSENYMTMDEGYLTTCDLDQPHYRIGAHRMDIWQHDKAVIHGMKIYIGSVPVMYLPYFVQDLKNRSIITFTPGESKDFGLFLLTTTRFKVGSHMDWVLHADLRERTGIGEGFDIKYNTPNFGSGLLSAYYTDENMIASHHLWDMYRSDGQLRGPTTHHERYRIIWRHHWRVDPNTDVILQYYKIHDYDILNQGFLKTYFPKDYQQNAGGGLDTYFLLTHNMPHGTLTFNVDTSRENRAIRGVERIPEIQYTMNNTEIGHSTVYFKSVDTFSDLSSQNDPKTYDHKTLRVDTNDDFSRPTKIGFLSINPHVGGEETFYSRTAEIQDNDIFRGMFRTGVDLSTKFYKVWDYHTDFMGLDINKLRHVITPTVSYLYQSNPTFHYYNLNQFDGIDQLEREHQITFGLENELQTKRQGQVVDLIRYIITMNYGLRGTTGRRGVGPYDTTFDFSPTNWWTLHNDNEYDFHFDHLNSDNFDTEFQGKGWSYSFGNRYTRNEGDALTSEWDYTINPKWSFRVYNAFPLNPASGGNTSARDNEYTLTRDMHEWDMDMTIDDMEGHGMTFFVLFRLKASPGMKLNLFSSTFAPSRPGNQNQ